MLKVKILTEICEEIEIKIQDDEMTEAAKDTGALVGAEVPRISQTMVAAREAEGQRALAAVAPAGIGLEDTGEGQTAESEASDEEVARLPSHLTECDAEFG